MIQIDKLRRLMEVVSAERGEFVLFGLFLREEAQDKWDLVISAPWLEDGKLKALGEFVEKAASIVGEKEFLTLSRIVTLNHDDPNLKKILETVQVDDDPLELWNTNFFGLEIKHAYILRAGKTRELEPAAT
ncbi:MAG TPA: hypothetical protein VEX60_09530 [Pyrinomonadaceae bacterium]|nr:hypothetical protein [Pyrinomonadaceae bacterium]